MKVKKWGLAAIGLVVAAGIVAFGAGVFGGVAQAQEPTDEKAGQHAQYQELLAENLGVTVAELEAAQAAARSAMIDEAVASGRITEEQAERLRNAEPGEHRRGVGSRMRHAVGNVFGIAADILGLSSEEVRDGLSDGNSLNDLAAQQGVTDLAAQIVGQITADVEAQVADGSITQEQADRVLENLTERVSNAVDHEGGKLRDGFGPRRHHMSDGSEN